MSATPTAEPATAGSILAGLPQRSNAGWREEYDRFFTPAFGQRRLALVRGAGARVWDADGNAYLDFLTGISVNNLGHCHPRVVQAIQEQAATLIHCTNIYYIPVQIELARLLTSISFADRVFFANSGAEANEAAIKLARRWIAENRGPGHHEIITMSNSFHGRTLATLTATGQEKVKHGFEPLLPGFAHVPFDDLAALEAAIGPQTGAVMLEPIQGEGGVHPPAPGYLRGVRELCDRHGLLMILDEVQTGLGRTGKLFGYEHEGVSPDIMTLAKSMAGGMAMGAMLCTDRLASAFGLGSHGTTMGGNPLASAASFAYLSELVEGEWPAHAAAMGERLCQRLTEGLSSHPNFKELRGRGMMIGLELKAHAPDVLLACEKNGLLVNVTAGQTVRLLPPLNLTPEEVDEGARILIAAVRACA